MVIIVDSREQKNQHILNYFEQNKIEYKKEKLEFGDYSFTSEGVDYRNQIVIERKNSITEICGNFAAGKRRFHNEFVRALKVGCKVHLMIEDSEESIKELKYRSQFSPRDIKNRLNTWCHSFMITLDFVSKDAAADHIIRTFKQYLPAP